MFRFYGIGYGYYDYTGLLGHKLVRETLDDQPMMRMEFLIYDGSN